MKKVFCVFLALVLIFAFAACADNAPAEPADTDVTPDEQASEETEVIAKNLSPEDAEYQIQVAMQYQLEDMFGDKVNDARIYVEKVYTAEEEQENELLKSYQLSPDEYAFEVKYELHPAEGVDINELMVANGDFDEESGWVKEKYNVGILRPNESGEPAYKITDFGTAF